MTKVTVIFYISINKAYIGPYIPSYTSILTYYRISCHICHIVTRH